MPVIIPNNLPAKAILEKENIFIMEEARALSQDIRPLKLLILNLMPNKNETETQLIRLLGNTPLQVEVTLLMTKTYQPKNTPVEHLENFYCSFDQIEKRKFDGMIITGAPVEHLAFEEVHYWQELTTIMDYAKENVTSVIYICWGAQAGLYYHYGIPKYPLPEKMFGIFKHRVVKPGVELLRGFDDEFYIPHSRHTEIKEEDIKGCPELEILATSEEAGVAIVATRDKRQIFITGHPEYDSTTLQKEYLRDLNKGLKINIPQNYFQDDDPSKEPINRWRGHANLLYYNWLNYYVYQITPYEL